jgi:predicted RNA binding protein YcfA (HicA-like mRNA interferase family)
MGSSRLPVAPGARHVKALEKLGWVRRRTTGSHEIMTKPGERATLSVPCHAGRDLRRGTLSAILKSAGVTEDDYLAAFSGKPRKRQATPDEPTAADPIRSAADAFGEPLSMADYQKWREQQDPRPPSALTLQRRHGSWSTACREANVKAAGDTIAE